MSERKTIAEWQDAVWQNAEDHGFHDKGANDNLPTQLANIHGEVSEAWEEFRKTGFDAKRIYFPKAPPGADQAFALNLAASGVKPEGFPTEMADIVIRVMDVCKQHGVDLEEAIAIKHAYNRTRPYKHNKVC